MSKACNRVKDQLSPYIDDMLSEEERAMVEKELTACASCREDAEFMKGIIQTAKTLPAIDVTDSFRAGLRERLEQEKAAETPVKRSYWRHISGFAAAAAVLVLSVITLNSLPEHPELTSETDPKQPKMSQSVATETPAPGGAESDTALSSPTEEGSRIVYSTAKETAGATRETERPAPSPEVAPAPESENNLKATRKMTTETEAPDTEAAMDIAAEAAPEQAEDLAGVPMMTSLLEAGEESALTDSASDSSTDAGPTAAPKQRTAASGGGGSAGSARMVMPTALSVQELHYYFSQDAIETARELLAAYPEEDGGFVIPAESLSEVQKSLESLSGYVRRDAPEEETAFDEVKIILYAE